MVLMKLRNGLEVDPQKHYEMVRDNNPFMREGQCNRCGKCCHFIINRETRERVPCEFLRYDGNTAVCLIYKTRPQNCKDHPVLPYKTEEDKEWYKDCGYTFRANIELEKQEALDRLNLKCYFCPTQKYQEACKLRIELIEDILQNCR